MNLQVYTFVDCILESGLIWHTITQILGLKEFGDSYKIFKSGDRLSRSLTPPIGITLEF